MMSAGVEQEFIAMQDAGHFRNVDPAGLRAGARIECPFLAQAPPGQELQVMGARDVVIPKREDLGGLFAVIGDERRGEPAVRQRMQVRKLSARS